MNSGSCAVVYRRAFTGTLTSVSGTSHCYAPTTDSNNVYSVSKKKKCAGAVYEARRCPCSRRKNVGYPGYTFAPGTNLSMSPLVLSPCVCPAAQDNK